MESTTLQVQERPKRKPIVWSNIGVGAVLQLFEVTTLGQPFEVIKTQLAGMYTTKLNIWKPLSVVSI